MLNQTCDVTYFRDSRVIVQVLKAKYPDMFLLTQEIKIQCCTGCIHFASMTMFFKTYLHGTSCTFSELIQFAK